MLLSSAPSQQSCVVHWLFPCCTTPPRFPRCCIATPPYLRSSSDLVKWKRVVILVSPLVINLPFCPSQDISLHLCSQPASGSLCWSPTFQGQPFPCSTAVRTHTWLTALRRPLRALCRTMVLTGLLCFFALFSFNWALIGELFLALCLRLRGWTNSPGVPHWTCLKIKSS